MRKGLIGLFVAGLVAGLAVASVATTYHVQVKSTRAQLLWSADEANLFVGTRLLGWRFSYLRLIGEFGLALVQTVTPPQQSKAKILMFRITPNGIERHLLDNADMVWPAFTVFEGRIHYGILWRWNGRQFDPVTPAQKEEYLAAKVVVDGDYSNLNGWSNYYFSPSPVPPGGLKYEITIGAQPMVLTVIGDTTRASAIELRRGDNPPEQIESLNEQPRSVNRAEYEGLFGR